ncbi:MAG: hypothetical protein ACK478_12660 [Flavobacteriales bacterium]|jgi:tetratricopeptide (TPR) repeat protein
MGNRINWQITIGTMLLWFIHLGMAAQGMPLTNEAAKLCQQKSYAAALKKADEAIHSDAESRDAYTWYVHGFVHKEIFKEEELGNRQSTHRRQAEESLLRAMKCENATRHEDMIKLALKYLASTYYNDALQSSQVIAGEDESVPRKLFADFRRLMNIAVPETNFLDYEKELEKSLGQHYFTLWQRDTEVGKWRDLATKRYASIVALDSTDSDAYYNLAVIDYNRAVFMYRKLGPDTDMFDAITLQEEASGLIRSKALVNMEKAYALAPEKGEIVRGIMMMHRALDHEKDVAYFKTEIERLINEGKIKADQPK